MDSWDFAWSNNKLGKVRVCRPRRRRRRHRAAKQSGSTELRPSRHWRSRSWFWWPQWWQGPGPPGGHSDLGGRGPDGSVTFTDAGVDLGTVTLNSSGQAALADFDLSAGSHSLEAEYSGSATYAPANSSPLAQVLTVQGSSTSLFAAPDPTGYGDTVVAVATVLPAAGSGMPTGTVALMNGGVSVATAPLSDGVAVFAVSTLEAGSDSSTAAYAGDGNFAASTSPELSQEVDKATTTTTLTVSPNPAQARAAVTLTATVTSGAAVADGTVSFSASGTSLGTAALSGGSATLTATFDQTGSQQLVATYAGDDNFGGSQSQPVQLSVHPASRCRGLGRSWTVSDNGVFIRRQAPQDFGRDFSRLMSGLAAVEQL